MTTFYKLHGAGNDFIFFADTETKTESRADEAKRLCDRHRGIGADGVAWLKHHSGNQFSWEFYNSDGSSAEMCGNAARCAMRLIHKVYHKTEMQLQTLAGVVAGALDGDDIRVSFDVSTSPLREISYPAGKEFLKGYLVTTGVPHCVIPAHRPHDLWPKTQELKAFLKNPDFGVGGANLTFADFQSYPIKTVSLERGVEEFTQACGTGVIATAKVYQYIYNKTGTLQLQSPGGAFKVSFEGTRPHLTGPAELIFKGEL